MVIHFDCETCRTPHKRSYAQGKIPLHFFCSVPCQNEWQKTRQDLIAKNKDPEFRKRVSEGLKRRKYLLGDDYHSPSTRRKIGDATIKHWNEYSEEKKQRLLKILYDNAQQLRVPGKIYNRDWYLLSQKHIRNNKCTYCEKSGFLHMHHIKPTRYGGTHHESNLCVLCAGCHKRIETITSHLIRLFDDLDMAVNLSHEIIAAGISKYHLVRKIIADSTKRTSLSEGETNAELTN